jgi:RNase H-fold protein (predicted Holliday junction resolvase)
MANNLMKGKAKGKHDDDVAAMLILQTYLDKIINNK